MSHRKRIEPEPLATHRLAELANIIESESYVVGPQDERDLIEALTELIARRNAERLLVGGPWKVKFVESAA